jgi:hypothetical protein
VLVEAIRATIAPKIEEVRGSRLTGTAPADYQIAVRAFAAILLAGWHPPVQGAEEVIDAAARVSHDVRHEDRGPCVPDEPESLDYQIARAFSTAGLLAATTPPAEESADA